MYPERKSCISLGGVSSRQDQGSGGVGWKTNLRPTAAFFLSDRKMRYVDVTIARAHSNIEPSDGQYPAKDKLDPHANATYQGFQGFCLYPRLFRSIRSRPMVPTGYADPTAPTNRSPVSKDKTPAELGLWKTYIADR